MSRCHALLVRTIFYTLTFLPYFACIAIFGDGKLGASLIDSMVVALQAAHLIYLIVGVRRFELFLGAHRLTLARPDQIILCALICNLWPITMPQSRLP